MTFLYNLLLLGPVHELGHLIAAKIAGYKIDHVNFSSHVSLYLPELLADNAFAMKAQLFFVLAAGGLANILFGLLTLWLAIRSDNFWIKKLLLVVSLSHLSTGLANLLPSSRLPHSDGSFMFSILNGTFVWDTEMFLHTKE